MQLRNVMTDHIIYVNLDTPIEQVAQLMQKHNVGSIPVCDQSGVKGIITDRDIVVRSVAYGTDSKTMKASDIMTSDIEYVTPNTSIEEVSRIMSQKQIRRLPVIEDNQLIGMVALGDLAVKGLYDVEVGEALSEISTPSHPNEL